MQMQWPCNETEVPKFCFVYCVQMEIRSILNQILYTDLNVELLCADAQSQSYYLMNIN
jgi:hypothetical protein